MTLHLGYIPALSVLYIPFHTFDSNGASITLTGLAVTDIEIYKNGSTTQRSSDSGYTLLDTDGIDFDSLTGIHGFSIDLSDNTDIGFYAAGSTYWVVISSVTVDTRTVSFVAATFFIGPVAANVTQLLGTAWLTPGTAGTPDVNTKLAGGTAWGSGAITSASIAADAITAAKIADGAIDAATFAAGAITATVIATGAIDADAIADNAIDAGSIAADAITAAKLHADVTTELQSGLATAANLATVAGYIDTEITTLQTSVDDLPTNAELATALDPLPTAAENATATWANATRTLTAISDSAGVTTLLSRITAVLEIYTAAHIRSAAGLASANLDTQLTAIDDAVDSEVASIISTLATILALVDTEIAAIKAKTDNLPSDPADQSAVEAAILAAWTTALTEAYRGTGATGTPAQLLYEIIAHLGESSISSTTKTLKKLDGSTTAKTYTLNSATTPTAITETT